MKKSLLYTVMGLLVVSCGWQEDPLIGKSDVLKRAAPEKPPVEKPSHENSEYLIIESLDAAQVAEGELLSIDIRVRLRDESAYDKNTLKLEIMNINQFPGAQYDASSGHFTWTPPLGFVSDGDFEKHNLNVRAWAEPVSEDGAVVSKGRQISVTVMRSLLNPELSASFPQDKTLREGESVRFSLKVIDRNSGMGDTDGPTIEFTPSRLGEVSLVNFITEQNRRVDPQTREWTFNYNLNLKEAELTSDSSIGSFSVIARSQHGRRSPPESWSVKVLTSLEKPRVSWDKEAKIIFGQQNRISFVVFDPKGEGKIKVTGHSALPNQAELDCAPPPRGYLTCEFRWFPSGDPANFPKTGRFTMSVTSESPVVGDNHSINNTFTFRYGIEMPKPAATSGGMQ